MKSFLAPGEAVMDSSGMSSAPGDSSSSFAQRLITGLAAERYFEAVHATLPEFSGCALENTTQYGCGYDFRLRAKHGRADDFLAVEVKGLKQKAGAVSMTTKEYEVAAVLKDKFFLFVVGNFRETPTHDLFRNPLSSQLQFRRVEQIIVQVSWLTSV